MSNLLKKDVKFLGNLVQEQLTYKFGLMPKTKSEDIPAAQGEIEYLYELKNKLKNSANGAPAEEREQE